MPDTPKNRTLHLKVGKTMTTAAKGLIRRTPTYKAIRDALLEDAQFSAFFWTRGDLGDYVIFHAYGHYHQNMEMWTTPGAFAHNYIEQAIRTIEPHVPSDLTEGVRNFYGALGKAMQDDWYDTAWTLWAEMLKAFSIGA